MFSNEYYAMPYIHLDFWLLTTFKTSDLLWLQSGCQESGGSDASSMEEEEEEEEGE